MTSFNTEPMLSPKNSIRIRPLSQFEIVRDAYLKAGIKHTVIEWLGYKYLVVSSINPHDFMLDKSKYSYLTFNKNGQLKTF